MPQTQQSLDLNWSFWNKQIEALQHLNNPDGLDVVVFRGGYGSGKSILGARATIQFALQFEGHYLVMGQDFAKGRDTYEILFEELPGDDLNPFAAGDPENSPIVKKYNHNEKRIVLINGSVIVLGSADKWNRYAGAEFNFIWCDEVAHYDNTDLYKLEEMLISRQRTKEGPNISLWTSTGNGYNDFYDFVVKQETPDGNDLPTRIKQVVANSLNNPFLSEKEKLQNRFEGTSREDEALKGGFSAAEGLVYKQFSRNKHIVNREDVELEEGFRMYGYDAGWDDPRVLLEIGRTSHGQLVVLDCFYERETHVSDVIDWIKSNDKLRGVIYAEHNPSDIDEFRRKLGWKVVKADKDIDGGIDEVRQRLRSDVDGRPGLLVCENCEELIKELFSYQEDHVGKSKAVDHAADALRYSVFTEGAESFVL